MTTLVKMKLKQNLNQMFPLGYGLFRQKRQVEISQASSFNCRRRLKWIDTGGNFKTKVKRQLKSFKLKLPSLSNIKEATTNQSV